MVKGGEGEWKKIKIKRVTRKCIVNILKNIKDEEGESYWEWGKKRKKKEKVNKYNKYTCEHDVYLYQNKKNEK